MPLRLHESHEQNRSLIEKNQRHGNGRLGNHIRRRRYDAGKDEGTYNKDPPFLSKGLPGHQSQVSEDDQGQWQFKPNGKRQDERDKKGQVGRQGKHGL